MGSVLEVEGVKKRYGRLLALRGVSFTLRPGVLVGLVGPNGAGKTTLIRVVVGILRPTEGRVRLFGRDPFREPRAREPLGYIPERPQLPSSIPVRELLRITAMLYGHPRPADAVDEAIALTSLEGHEYKRFDQLSAGLKQRAAIAHALIHEPRLIIADEPTANLDPVERVKILQILSDLNRKMGLTVLFTSHVLAEVSRLGEEIIVLLGGRVAFVGSPERLVEMSKIVRVRTSDPEKLSRLLAERGYNVEVEAFSVRVELKSRAEISRLFRDLSEIEDEVPVYNVDTVEAALEGLLRGGGGEAP